MANTASGDVMVTAEILAWWWPAEGNLNDRLPRGSHISKFGIQDDSYGLNKYLVDHPTNTQKVSVITRSATLSQPLDHRHPPTMHINDRTMTKLCTTIYSLGLLSCLINSHVEANPASKPYSEFYFVEIS